MKQSKSTWFRSGLVGMLVCLGLIAGTRVASADVAPGPWATLITFQLVEVFGFTPRTGSFAIRLNTNSSVVPPFGFPVEGIANVTPICTSNVRENGGHSESWVGAAIGDPATVASINSQLLGSGFLQHSAKSFIIFFYGASLGDGSFGQIFPPCIQPVGVEGALLLSVYAQQTVFNGQFLNGELLYCSLNTTWADPNSFLEFCNPYFILSGTSL